MVVTGKLRLSARPGAGSQATDTAAALSGRKYVVRNIYASIGATGSAPAAGTLEFSVRHTNGTGTVVFTTNISHEAVAGKFESIFLTGLELELPPNTAIWAGFSAGVTNLAESLLVTGDIAE